jgi:hypothetical protein
MAPVRCADCGFLAVREKASRRLVEVEKEMRDEWQLPLTPSITAREQLIIYEEWPVCFAMAADLPTEAQTAVGNNPDAYFQGVGSTLHRQRDCESFITWEHGFTPKEHRDTMIAKELIEDQRRWQEEQSRIARRQTIWNVILGGAIALAGGVVTKLLIG